MKFSVMNLGCKVNAYESESVAALFEVAGYERTEFGEACDVAVIFTCAVTNTAAQKSRQMVHRARRKNPDAIVAVAGCYVQIDPDVLGDVQVLVGTADKTKIPEFVEEYRKTGVPVRHLTDMENMPFENMGMDRFEYQSRAYLKVQDGCNQFCSYCVIPYARGRERSMAPDDVIREAKKLAENHREIVLTGIHTGRYGREYGVSLAQLMKRILAAAPKLERLRISSIEITEIDDELIDLLQHDKRVARHLHIPLQSGCDTVLQRMNRPYSTAEYYARIEKIREVLPDISISADLITGFPQETEEEHRRTCDFLRQCRFSFLHVFPYSLRSGTAAEKMSGHLAPEVKRKRAAECMAISEELYDIYKSGWLGRQAEVLYETARDGYTAGHTSEYLPVRVEGIHPAGEMAAVLISELQDHQLYGKAVNQSES